MGFKGIFHIRRPINPTRGLWYSTTCSLTPLVVVFILRSMLSIPYLNLSNMQSIYEVVLPTLIMHRLTNEIFEDFIPRVICISLFYGWHSLISRTDNLSYLYIL